MQEEREKKSQRIYKIIMLVILTSFITFMITSLTLYTYYTNNPSYTFITGTSETTTSGLSQYLDKLKSVIEKNYLWNDEIDEIKLEEAAIKGYVQGLGDEYTEYIPQEEMQEFTEDITGSFVGIGIYMVADEENQQILVYYPIPDSPAEKAGIKSGDVIISVDDVEYGYEQFDIIADYIKGEPGTKVKLVIEREGKKMDFEITREKVDTNPITTKNLESNVGYLKIPSFDADTAEKFKEKTDDLIKNGAKSLIIDLRNNGGGIVDSSTKIADYFLDKGNIIMSTKDNKKNEEKTISENKPIYDLPVVVLINENTASASEILTAALKENQRATVIGTKTYGKGVIQTVITLSDGSGLKITTEEYFTPNGSEINKKGIQPTEEVKLPDTVSSVYSVSEENDTQLKKAIEKLSK